MNKKHLLLLAAQAYVFIFLASQLSDCSMAQMFIDFTNWGASVLVSALFLRMVWRYAKGVMDE